MTDLGISGRLAARFLATMVDPGHLDEARAAEILTARIARQTHRLLRGTAESGLRMTPADLATVLNGEHRSDIGAELDSLARFGRDRITTRRTAAEGLAWLRRFLSLSLPAPITA